MVSVLLAHGANALLQDTVHSRTCLHYAAIHGHAACIDILLSDGTFASRAGETMLLRDARLVDGKELHRYASCCSCLPGAACLRAVHAAACQPDVATSQEDQPVLSAASG